MTTITRFLLLKVHRVALATLKEVLLQLSGCLLLTDGDFKLFGSDGDRKLCIVLLWLRLATVDTHLIFGQRQEVFRTDFALSKFDLLVLILSLHEGVQRH